MNQVDTKPKKRSRSSSPVDAESNNKIQKLEDNEQQDQEEFFQSQPHLCQCAHPLISPCPMSKEHRQLDVHNAPRAAYFKRLHHEKSVLHWGQRKLLMSEMEFLTEFSEPGDVVVYAGAAPGTHIGFLSDLFPELLFVLIDPIDFMVEPIANRIQIRQEYFTDDVANEYSSLDYREKLLFISDIRRDARNEAMITEDMMMQARWHKMMHPKKSMLKFRLPWTHGFTRYLSGTIVLPVWGPQSTTESRLIVSEDAEEVDYDHKKYEEQMFYFNTVQRVTFYPHDIEVEGFDNCFDCASEVFILQQYIWKMRQDHVLSLDPNKQDDQVLSIDYNLLKFEVEMMIDAVTQECSVTGRDLFGLDVSSNLKDRNQFIDMNFAPMSQLTHQGSFHGNEEDEEDQTSNMKVKETPLN